MRITLESNACVLLSQRINAGARVFPEIAFLKMFDGQIQLPCVTIH